MPETPGIGFPPDSATNLWRKVSLNLFELAEGAGVAPFPEPNALDNEMQSMRKCVNYTADYAEATI